jgi:hypothetical protein
LLARVLVFGETVIVEGAVPVVALRPSQLDVALADHPSTPVPRFEICKVCGFGFKLEATKKFKLVGVTDSTAVFTANVTGIEIGEFVAPGAESVTVAL